MPRSTTKAPHLRVLRCGRVRRDRQKNEYDVLVVDDERSIAQGTARLLAPLRAVVVGNIKDAMAALVAYVPEVVLCDFFLKGEDAMPLLKFVTDKHPGVRRVIYSGYRDPAVRNALEQGYADVILAKPATLEQLMAAIKPSAETK
jgi:DNA-binding NtrC family response regulator